jgi:hypothetical protein
VTNLAGYGQWAWIHHCDEELDYSRKGPGLITDSQFCLPPAFAARLGSTSLLDRVNHRFGILLDWYEEEDVSSVVALGFIAGALQQCFRGHELEQLVDELASFILAAAESGRCLTFRL